mgnify:CR=1 FL=1
MVKQDLYQINMIKHTLTGWKTFKIGVFLDNYTGDIEFLHIIVINVEKSMLPKVCQKNVVNVDVNI